MNVWFNACAVHMNESHVYAQQSRQNFVNLQVNGCMPVWCANYTFIKFLCAPRKDRIVCMYS